MKTRIDDILAADVSAGFEVLSSGRPLPSFGDTIDGARPQCVLIA